MKNLDKFVEAAGRYSFCSRSFNFGPTVACRLA